MYRTPELKRWWVNASPHQDPLCFYYIEISLDVAQRIEIAKIVCMYVRVRVSKMLAEVYSVECFFN